MKYSKQILQSPCWMMLLLQSPISATSLYSSTGINTQGFNKMRGGEQFHVGRGQGTKASNESLKVSLVSGGFASHMQRRGSWRGGESFDMSNASDLSDNSDVPVGRVRSRLMSSSLKADKSTGSHNNEQNPNSISSLKEKHNGPPLKVLFLSADTGGGHRASAESLANQFERHYPGSQYDLVDVWSKDGCFPYRTLVPAYKHLSAHPQQWRFLYHVSNTSPHLLFTKVHSHITCERKIRKTIASYDPDIVVSVHPTMQNVPLIATRNIAKKLGKIIPFVTVVTDFGSGHCHWFHKHVDKTYVASNRIRKLANRRGGVPQSKLVQIGLPIRNDFAIQAEAMGDRTSVKGKKYQAKIRQELGLSPDKKMVLVMGGGEGVGSLSSIVDSLYAAFVNQGIEATIVVVCGRNQKLVEELKVRDWDKMAADYHPKGAKKYSLFRLFSKSAPSRRIQESLDKFGHGESTETSNGNVDVIGLGFITNMAEYMVAADVLVTKAGPGTIAEAAALGLPVMLTSYLPGQEAGNVDIVLDGGFGDFCANRDGIAEEVACWLQDDALLEIMSKSASAVGAPNAASDIVLDIGKLAEASLEQNQK